MLESQVAKDIDRYLTETLGLRVLRADQGGGRFRKRTVGVGMPDRFGILPNGRMWAVEIKAPGARPRPNEAKQNETLLHLVMNYALVIRASSVSDVQCQLNPETLRRALMETDGKILYIPAWAEAMIPVSPPRSGVYQPERDEV